MRRGLDLAARKRLDLHALPTHTFAIDDVDEAFAALASKPPGFIKSVVVMGAEAQASSPAPAVP